MAIPNYIIPINKGEKRGKKLLLYDSAINIPIISYGKGPHIRPCRKFVLYLCLRLLRLRKFVTSSFQIESVPQIETNNFQTYLQNIRFKHVNIK